MDCGHYQGSQVCCEHGHAHRGGDECCHRERGSAEGCCHGHGEDCECRGAAEEHGSFHRRFRSRDEQVAELEAYRKELQEELKGVEERIAELRPAT